VNNFTPREIVSELDRYIIGQNDAKRAVAVALRNRWRRQQVPAELRDEIAPKNIIMIGPTGVGKTEIARRLAKLAQAPFIKVEASKFTEVGYVGRDVESMVRDLLELAINMVKTEETKKMQLKAEANAEEKLLDLLLPGEADLSPDKLEQRQHTRDRLRKLLRLGELEDRFVEVEVEVSSMPAMGVFTPQGNEEMGMNIKEMFGNLFPKNTKHKRVKVSEARVVAAGAFHMAKPSDLIPELQGRFPIRVELNSLDENDFYRILTEPKNALIRQYKELMKTESIDLDFDDEAIREMAKIAKTVNERTENIGARRLHTILEKLLEELSFTAPELTEKQVRMTADEVRSRLVEISQDEDLSRYIL